jgi:hypothetical protein
MEIAMMGNGKMTAKMAMVFIPMHVIDNPSS